MAEANPVGNSSETMNTSRRNMAEGQRQHIQGTMNITDIQRSDAIRKQQQWFWWKTGGSELGDDQQQQMPGAYQVSGKNHSVAVVSLD